MNMDVSQKWQALQGRVGLQQWLWLGGWLMRTRVMRFGRGAKLDLPHMGFLPSAVSFLKGKKTLLAMIKQRSPFNVYATNTFSCE